MDLDSYAISICAECSWSVLRREEGTRIEVRIVVDVEVDVSMW